MIAALTGKLACKSPSQITLDVQGVGYELFIPLSTFYSLPDVNESASLRVHTHLREDALQLFGFLTSREKDAFILLTGISGIGPKLALSVLSTLSVADLVSAIHEGDMSRGNRNVILCERGIRTFETQYRNTLDLAAVPSLKELSHLPVIVDPSHATGKWQLVAPMAKAAVAAGADGLLIEVHSNPECALCDGEESIKPTKFKELMPPADARFNAEKRSSSFTISTDPGRRIG